MDNLVIENNTDKSNFKKKIIILTIISLVCITFGILAWFYVKNNNNKNNYSIQIIQEQINITESSSKNLIDNLKLNNVNISDISFDLSSDIGTISNGIFTPNKSGKAKVTLTYGNITLDFEVIVEAKIDTTTESGKNNVSFYADDVLIGNMIIDDGGILNFTDIKIDAPYKKGYTFTGWLNDDKKLSLYSGGVYYAKIEINSDIKLIANYQKAYIINLVYDENITRILELNKEDFDNIGKFLTDGLEPYEYDQELKKEKGLKDGYTFVGWYLDNNKITSDTKLENDNVTIVAKYEKSDDYSYLDEYKNFEVEGINASFIYELDKKTMRPQSFGDCDQESAYYFNKIGKVEDYSFESKIANIISIISPNVKCGNVDNTYDINIYPNGCPGCYISPETVEKKYKYIYGNDSYYENLALQPYEKKHGYDIRPGYIEQKQAYYNPIFHLGTCSMGVTRVEKITSVVKYDDRIELTKKAIYCQYNYNDNSKTCYDYEESYKNGDREIISENYNDNFDEIKDKLDSYIFVFKKDSKDNYYLYEVKKEEAN